MSAMLKFLSKILRQKKAIILVLLFLVISGLLIPKISRADVLDDIGKWNPFSFVGKLWCLTPWDDGCHFAQQNSKAFVNNVADTWGEVVMAPFAAIVLAVGYVLVYLLGTIAQLSASLLNVVRAWDVGCYTCMGNPAVAYGWPMVRDLANMFIVMGFVLVGLATILRIRDYEAKKLLPTLIIAALLINFSLVITGIFIDGSNIMSKHFSESGGMFDISWSESMDTQTSMIWDAFNSTKDYKEAAAGVVGAAAGLAFYNIVAMIVFFLYAFIYLFRHMALWILVILSPLAFVCYVFPFTKNIWNMWWNNFFQWCIIIVPISFFDWISAKTIEGLKTAKGAGEELSMVTYLIPGSFMLIGFIFSLKISAMGAGAAIGAFKWSGGKVMGATGGTLKGLGGALKNTQTGQKVSTAVGETLERIGLRSQGVTKSKQNELNKKAHDRLNQITDNSQLAKIAEGAAISPTAKRDKAVAGQILAERNALNAINPNKLDAVAAYSTAFGIPKETFTKARPETFAGVTDAEANTKVITDEAKRYSALTGKSMQESLKTVSATYKATPDEIRNAKTVLEQRKITENALGLSPVSDKDVSNRLIEEQQKTLIDAGHTREEALAMTKKFVPNAGQIADAKDRITQERINKAVSKLAPAKIPDLPIEAINARTIGAFSENQLKEGVARRGTAAQFEKVKKYGDPNTPEGKEFGDIISTTMDPVEHAKLWKIFGILKTL